MNTAFIRRIQSRFCPHKEIKTSEIFFLWRDSHFIVTACINQWIIVSFNNNIMNKFWFKFFGAVESNCSSNCMYVCYSEFLSDSHFIVTACINQWIIIIYNNNILNKFWFKFKSNCSSDCMSVASSFNNDKKNMPDLWSAPSKLVSLNPHSFLEPNLLLQSLTKSVLGFLARQWLGPDSLGDLMEEK